MAAFLALRFAGRRCAFGSLRTSVGGLGIAQSSPAVQCDHLLARNFSTTDVVQAGKAGKHWWSERVVAVGLLGLVPAGFFFPGAVVNYGLAMLVPLHGHWGFESVIEDYVPIESMKKYCNVLLYCVSIGTFAGLMYLNIYDIGICGAIKAIWSV